MMNSFVITCGDINGIGPEIALKAIAKYQSVKSNKFIFICPKNVFQLLYSNLQYSFDYEIVNKLNQVDHSSNLVSVVSISNAKANFGKPTATSGRISYNSIVLAIEAIELNIANAIVTAPISKEGFYKAGINFPGHTELLASKTGNAKPLMCFLSNNFKAALHTIHIPLKDVHKTIKKKTLSSTIKQAKHVLKNDLGVSDYKIAVLGLNPHSGENGLLGKEEQDIVKPVIDASEKVFGPFVPDAFFANHLYKKFDMVLGLYHDQVLIPFKMINFNSGVNYTGGLSIVRTSPDHGTAFDIAGKLVADSSSMEQAYLWAKRIVKNRAEFERR